MASDLAAPDKTAAASGGNDDAAPAVDRQIDRIWASRQHQPESRTRRGRSCGPWSRQHTRFARAALTTDQLVARLPARTGLDSDHGAGGTARAWEMPRSGDRRPGSPPAKPERSLHKPARHRPGAAPARPRAAVGEAGLAGQRVRLNLQASAGELNPTPQYGSGLGPPPPESPTVGLGEHAGILGPTASAFSIMSTAFAPLAAPMAEQPRRMAASRACDAAPRYLARSGCRFWQPRSRGVVAHLGRGRRSGGGGAVSRHRSGDHGVLLALGRGCERRLCTSRAGQSPSWC